MHPMMYRIRILLSLFFMAFGAVMILGAGINRIEKPQDNPWGSVILLGLIVGVVPVVGGMMLLRKTRQHNTRARESLMERTVLQLARSRGELTVAEVATHSSLSVEEAQHILNALNLKGINSMDVSDSGVIVYRFPAP